MEAPLAFFCFSFSLSLYLLPFSFAVDTINSVGSIRGEETLVSAGKTFELGFFTPGDSRNWYLGIWYKNVSVHTTVWVANRETSMANRNGTLKLDLQGNLVLVNQNESAVWSSNSSGIFKNPVAQLLDSGNLVVREENETDQENFLWQSFDYPCATLLPGMKIGRTRGNGLDRVLTSWKNDSDPSRGNFTYRLEPNGYPQLLVSEGSVIRYRRGPWSGARFSGVPGLYKLGYVFNEKEVYYSYEKLNSSMLLRIVLSPDGFIQLFIWSALAQQWSLYAYGPVDHCDAYAPCGAYAGCNINVTPLCNCMKGFVPKFRKNWVWETEDWSSGCDRKIPLECKGDVFLKYSDVKLPDTQRSWFNTSLNLADCKMICQKDCTCTAYANLDVREGGNWCLLWFGDLIDIQEHAKNGQDLFIRMSSSESVQSVGEGASRRKKKKLVIIVISVFTGIIVAALSMIVYLHKKKQSSRQGGEVTGNQKEDLELPLFDFATIATATGNFSIENKLGEGGFGPVYKGILKEGQEIAVKRLSWNSKQGQNEFRNEVICIAKLQHRNLVKLVGCCVQEEKMLLYEYMPNKSLDFFIFDQMQRQKLNWQKRFDIINGIGRGLLYLHQDSRLRIVHRDLKASNVLLDHDMNPKISDFGLARSFGGNETVANTNRIVGTYGYMSPEYATDGIFSIKSDVFSYGVLVLEIVAGKKNRGFFHPDHYHNLLGHAWKLFKKERSSDLTDDLLGNSCNLSEVSRSIHVALLCVQRSPEDRPNMPSVVLMLGSENSLPEPKEPGFFTEREIREAESLASNQQPCSVNEITQTTLSAR